MRSFPIWRTVCLRLCTGISSRLPSPHHSCLHASSRGHWQLSTGLIIAQAQNRHAQRLRQNRRARLYQQAYSEQKELQGNCTKVYAKQQDNSYTNVPLGCTGYGYGCNPWAWNIDFKLSDIFLKAGLCLSFANLSGTGEPCASYTVLHSDNACTSLCPGLSSTTWLCCS